MMKIRVSAKFDDGVRDYGIWEIDEMSWLARKTPLWEQGDDLYVNGNVRLRNAPVRGEYRVVDRYGSTCLQSSVDGAMWAYVEIYNSGYETGVEKWEILGKRHKCSIDKLLNVAREIRGEPIVVMEYLDKKGLKLA